jgi:hypothetical protein
MNAIRRILTLAAGLALALILGACGPGDTPGCTANPAAPECRPSPSPSPTARPPVILDGGSGALPAFFIFLRDVATTETGTFDITVDWTFPTNDVDVALIRGRCSFEQLIADQCVFIDMTSSVTRKPEQIRVTNQPPGQYTVAIANFGPEDESVAYQVVFTPGAGAASASRGAAIARPDKVLRLRGVAQGR